MVSVEMSIYLDDKAKDAIEQNADDGGYQTTSAYVRSQLTECDGE